MNSTAVSMTDSLPWSTSVPRNILICDSIETDGRFLLHTLALQALAGNNSILWLAGGPLTDRQVATALKKIGCDVATGYLRDNAKTQSLSIRSLSVEISSRITEEVDGSEWDAEVYLKQVYQQVKTWVQKQSQEDKCPCWVLLDDVSSLASILGDRVVHCFIDSLSALSARMGECAFGVAIRCSHDVDQELIKRQAENENKANTGWVGAGGLSLINNQREWIPWERHLVELADGIVDVVPLTSGYSREAHGRLIFSETPGGRGWGEGTKQQQTTNAWNNLVINYCITDNGVRAIRLRGATS
jgi:hypothetical protein